MTEKDYELLLNIETDGTDNTILLIYIIVTNLHLTICLIIYFNPIH